MKDIMTTAELTRELNLGENTLRSWRIKGKGPKYFKAGRVIRYRREDVEAWIEENKK